MSDRPARTGNWPALVLLLLALLPLYILSSGPAAWVLRDGEFAIATWNTVYRPVGLLAETTGTEKEYVRYVQWWIARK